MARNERGQGSPDSARSDISRRTLSPIMTGGFAAALSSIGALTMILAPTSGATLAFALVALPLVTWSIITRSVSTALIFTTIGELYSGSNGTWLSVGPLSIRWALIFGTIVVDILIRLWLWRPTPSKRADRPRYAIAVLSYGALFPIVLFLMAMVGTENGGVAAFQSLGFVLVLLIYFPLRHGLLRKALPLLPFLIGLSITLVLLLLLMSVGPVALREKIIANVTGEELFGFNVTGLSRQSSVQIVLLFFPAFLCMFELTRANGLLRKGLLALGALFFLLPMIVTFLAGTLLSMFFMLLVSSGILMLKPVSRANGGKVIVALVAFAATVLSVGALLTPDLLEAKLLTRASLFYSGVGELDARRVSEVLIAAEDVQTHLWLGHGAGATMNVDENGPESGHTVELEGLMTFHLFGLIGCSVFMVGFAAFAFHPISVMRKRKSFDSAVAASLALWATACSIICAGMINPYLTTPFPALFISLYLVWNELAL
jgi:hypothetical protein